MSEIVKSLSIENLINQRAAIAKRLESASKLLKEANDIAQVAGLGKLDYLLRHIDVFSKDWLPTMSRGLDASAWKYLMHESGLRTFMDSKARNQWDTIICERKTPELNETNIRNTFADLYDSRQKLLERGVIECFRQLSWEHSTNLPQKFGGRIILKKFCHTYNCYGRKSDALDDLVRVFSVLHSRPEPDHRNGISQRFSEASNLNKMEFMNEYFILKWFKNGNAHVKFLNLADIEKLNDILARHYPNALPPPK
ncbi:DUF4942 domain-containing protein [Iodobacter sp. CM08]|uniref:DUF4942 domain-containing protein n=1 Tax=Iodobacter sp. CM08 TaxID=3085902 RepID=UPI002981D175|nr:DUF4942 domain-containing protein [Iodobacter sp. CM08]MDW5418097.1 DUF4942 domain-containing protein [Iodobacter sp. CM08]